MSGRLPRLLCFHGLYQNSDIFRQKTAGIAKSLKGVAELVYVCAPHIVHPTPRLGNTRPPTHLGKAAGMPIFRSWWTEGCNGWEESLGHVQRVIAAEGPFQGVMGFSQGATMAGLLCTSRVQSKIGFKPEVAILISGRLSDRHHAEYAQGVCPGIVSVHCIGMMDQVTPPKVSEHLMRQFQAVGPETTLSLVWEGGHSVPGPHVTKMEDMVVSAVKASLLSTREDRSEMFADYARVAVAGG